MIAAFFASLTRAKMFGIIIAIGIALFAFAYFKGRGDGKDAERVKVQEASTEAVLDAVEGERKANANSAARQDAFEAEQAQIRKDVDDAKANGGDAVDAYLRSLCQAQGNCPKDKPAK